jgi:alpha-galactosidase
MLRPTPIRRVDRAALPVACLIIWLAAGASAAAENIVFLGNSITKHGPDPSIDWPGNWGMAASAAALDYVNQVTAILRQSQRLALQPVVLSTFSLEQEFFQLSSARIQALLREVPRARIVVLQLGDNLDLSGERADGRQFAQQYAKLLSALRTRVGREPRLLCIGKWWPWAPIDAQIERQCEAANGIFIAISDLHSEPWGRAASERQFATQGVADHPGDRAMRQIALRVVHGVTGVTP